MALIPHLAALVGFVGFAVSGFADGNVRTQTPPAARGAKVPTPLRVHPPAIGCHWQRDAGSGRLSARWMT